MRRRDKELLQCDVRGIVRRTSAFTYIPGGGRPVEEEREGESEGRRDGKITSCNRSMNKKRRNKRLAKGKERKERRGRLEEPRAKCPESLGRVRVPFAVCASSRRGTRTRDKHKSRAIRKIEACDKARQTRDGETGRRRGLRREACDNKQGEQASEESKSLETM